MIVNEDRKDVVTVDLHCMQVAEAKNYLDIVLETVPSSIKEIIVIHGYHNGTAILNMVRKDFNKRVSKKYLSLNQGVTSLILN